MANYPGTRKKIGKNVRRAKRGGRVNRRKYQAGGHTHTDGHSHPFGIPPSYTYRSSNNAPFNSEHYHMVSGFSAQTTGSAGFTSGGRHYHNGAVGSITQRRKGGILGSTQFSGGVKKNRRG